MTGNAMAGVAIPWFVLQTTGSAAKTGFTFAVIGLSNVLAAFFGGPVEGSSSVTVTKTWSIPRLRKLQGKTRTEIRGPWTFEFKAPRRTPIQYPMWSV
jgi:hypothetical protein